ncbi:lactonase family protein [Pseudomonas sp. R5(2019)]|uniref:lactonase family protein n=1 Tax=Pseudomonas sp. R5(2019) TaxID=2697566 RepID=UPI001412D0F9|nr:lactonase family protein [Pseudomonas sp. R5(2019)]NBA95471.1 beta-propeller fold lactonase family protein [Pseudomonas sp. R5(2019)]
MDRAKTLKRLASAALLVGASQTWANTFVYVSNAADGTISSYELSKQGQLQPLATTEAGAGVMPLALSPDHSKLYASIRGKPYSVATYAIDPASGALKHLKNATVADSLAYISTDKTGHYLFGASYGEDLVSVNSINADGEVTDNVQQAIKTGPNAHSIIVDKTNRFVYAANLGADKLLEFRFDAASGKLDTLGHAELPKDSGPRHPVISPDNRFLYLLSEMAGSVTTFAINPNTGQLTALGEVNAIPADSGLVHGAARPMIKPGQPVPPPLAANLIWAADIALTPDGRFLYTSERTGSTVSVFTVDRDSGLPNFVQNLKVEQQPRGITVDPSGQWLLVTGEKSPNVGVYAIDPSRGTLTQHATAPSGKGANWVQAVSYP